MSTFIKPEQEQQYQMHNLPVNIEHVKAISKAMTGFYFSIVFQFNERQSFEWRYRLSHERDSDYNRIMSIISSGR